MLCPGDYLGSAPYNLQVPFLQQATLLRQGVKAALPNTQKQTQGGCQIEETKKYGPNEEQKKKNPEKELNKMGITNLSHTEFRTLVIRMLKELSEYDNIKEEMQVTLNEMRKIYRDPTAEERKLEFKSTIGNIRKK